MQTRFGSDAFRFLCSTERKAGVWRTAYVRNVRSMSMSYASQWFLSEHTEVYGVFVVFIAWTIDRCIACACIMLDEYTYNPLLNRFDLGRVV